MKKLSVKNFLPWLLIALLVAGCALCLLAYKNTAGLLLSQSAAERWQGENETAFAQASCFTSAADSISEEEIYNFRMDQKKK